MDRNMQQRANLDGAAALIEQFERGRREPESMPKAAMRALAHCLGAQGAARAAQSPIGKALIDISLEVEGQAAQGSEPPYHGAAHFKEAVHAMAALCKIEFSALPEPERESLCALGILCMAGHDLLHDGTRNAPGKSLEAISFQACLPHMLSGGMGEDSIAAAKHVIMGTEDRLYPLNRQHYLDDAASSVSIRDPLARLRLLANEADLCASLLPGSGQLMGALLAKEWDSAGFPEGASVGSWASRPGFLAFAATASDASAALGIEQARVDQLAAFDALGLAWGLDSRRQAGEKLDQIAARDGAGAALAIYARELGSIRPALAAAAYGDQAAPPTLDRAPAARAPIQPSSAGPAPSGAGLAP